MPPPETNPPSPQNHKIFDAWNSSSTGHQRAEIGSSNATIWRDIRSSKLDLQFRNTANETNQPAPFDGSTTSHVTPPSETLPSQPEWKWVSEAEAKRINLGVQDIRSYMGINKRKAPDANANANANANGKEKEVQMEKKAKVDEPESEKSDIFAGITVYINGSTLPTISDHKLKYLLVEHGGRVSISMARKTVTHVIVGKPGTRPKGAGGGLAAGKLQREIERGGWKGVRVVGVDWYVSFLSFYPRGNG